MKMEKTMSMNCKNNYEKKEQKTAFFFKTRSRISTQDMRKLISTNLSKKSHKINT